MKQVLAHIQNQTTRFAERPLFKYLADENFHVTERLKFAPCMAHFVFSFMDINQFLLPEVQASNEYHHLINTHAKEDAWHWPWYLHDIDALRLDPQILFSDALRFLWGEATRQSRLLSYRCMTMIGAATTLQKIAMIETIEMTGNVFLRHTAQLCTSAQGLPCELLYFGQNHADCETGHHMGTVGVLNMLDGIVLQQEERTTCILFVDELFSHYCKFADEMLLFAQQVQSLGPEDILQQGRLVE